MARRRDAAQTRREIVDVTRQHLVERGLEGLTLDVVASEVGISRQAILHHFGSRAGLMEAVVEDAWGGLFHALRDAQASDQDPLELLEAMDKVVRGRGHARIGAWLLLSGRLEIELFRGAAARAPATDSSTEEARRLWLYATALLGDALFGEHIRAAVQMPDGETERAEQRRWLAALLERDSTGTPGSR